MMKKILYLFLITLLLMPVVTYAAKDNETVETEVTEEVKENKKETVKLEECVDVTTVKLRGSNDEIFKAKLLAVDDPTDEDVLVEAKQYACNILVNASKIVVEYDNNGKEEDSYGRKLVWLFADDELLQNQLVLEGYASVNSLYDTYEYTATLQDSEILAKKEKIGIWKEKVEPTKEPVAEEKKEKNFFQSLIDNVLGMIAKFIDDILEKILNLVEDML
ncbi:MAG: thermonuclease family protein [Tenericutes bacterium]|nr:thermonuclease family protein [Mycoplasmatota bacterium]